MGTFAPLLSSFGIVDYGPLREKRRKMFVIVLFGRNDVQIKYMGGEGF